MPDIFDQVAKQQGAAPASSAPPSGGNDIFAQVAAKQKAAPPAEMTDTEASQKLKAEGVPVMREENTKNLERMKGGVKEIARQAGGLASAVGADKLIPGFSDAVKKRTTPSNPEQETGGTMANVGLLLAPIPGLGKLEAAKTAGLGAKAAYGAVRGAIDTGVRAAAETGDAKEAATGAATGAAGGALTSLLAPISKFLAKNARSQYAKVIHPEGMAAKDMVGSKLLNGKDTDLVGRGVMASSKEKLVSRLHQEMKSANDAVEAAWNKLPQGAQMKADPIARSVVDWVQKKAMLPNGQVSDPEMLKKGAKMVSDFLTKVAPNLSDADPHDVRAFRQMLDSKINAAGLPINGRSTAFRIRENLANSIRKEIDKQLPDIGKLNKTYSFWKSAEDMMKRSVDSDVGKKEWHEGIGGLLAKGGAAATIGGAIGYQEGHDKDSAFIGAAAGAALAAATRSTAWRTVSPVMKDRISKLIVNGQGKYAAELATRAVGLSMVRTTKPYNSYVQTGTPPSDQGIPPATDSQQKSAGSSPTPP